MAPCKIFALIFLSTSSVSSFQYTVVITSSTADISLAPCLSPVPGKNPNKAGLFSIKPPWKSYRNIHYHHIHKTSNQCRAKEYSHSYLETLEHILKSILLAPSPLFIQSTSPFSLVWNSFSHTLKKILAHSMVLSWAIMDLSCWNNMFSSPEGHYILLSPFWNTSWHIVGSRAS